MPSYVALLRAVNVGTRKLKMEGARKALEDSGFLDVASHIQTGNILVSTPMRNAEKVGAEVGRVLSEHAGFEIVAVVRTPRELAELEKAVDGIPSPPGPQTRRYVMFCGGTVGVEAAAALHGWDRDGERAHVIGKDVLVELGKAFHEARLGAAQVEKITGLSVTARDLKVVRAMVEKWSS
jgi:uncharacterized protein (DUF1697 family)